MARVLVGTSGYSYQHWKGVLYGPGVPQRLWLDAYASVFTTVELNVTYYSVPKAETFAAWADRTPEGFRFALKGPRTITHYRRLLAVEEPLAAFAERLSHLATKAEVVLWQLPPRMPADAGRLDAFAALLEREMSGMRHAFEFRHDSWFADPVYDVLRARRAALVVAHAPWRAPVEVLTAPFVYLRLHAGGERPDGCYTERELSGWAGSVKRWAASGRDVYAYFNNDPHGCAVHNALRLAELTGAPLGAAPHFQATAHATPLLEEARR